MKLFLRKTVLLALGAILVCIPLTAQTVSLSLDNVTVKEAILQLKEQTGYSLMYAANDLDTRKVVSVHATDLQEAVGQILKGQNVDWEIHGKSVVVSKRKSPQKQDQSQTAAKTIKGYVLDEDGKPLPGATVQVGNSSKGVLTDINGAYEIKASPSEELTYSFVGMKPQVVRVSERSIINVELAEESSEIEDAVVVAFGKQKKESITGSITTVDTKVLKVPSSDLTASLAGNMAGVIAFSRSGDPGEDNTNFFVRGVTTFEGSTNPLILIDNIELTPTDLARLQPDDIESFSILKDATATALYGSRAANGVILVTTKRGTESPLKIFVRLENSFSSPTKMVELADNVTYMKLANEAVLTRDPLASLPFSQDKIEHTGKPGSNPYIYPDNDWYEMLFKKFATSQRANMNLSGGGRVATYFVSIGATRDNGLLKVDHRNSFNNNIDSRKYSVRANVDMNLTKTTKLGVRVTGNFDDYSGPLSGGDAVFNQIMQSSAVLFPATYEPDADHTYVQHILFGNYGAGNYTNPYANMVRGYMDRDRSQMLAVLDLRQDLDFITKGLDFSAMVNISRLSSFGVQRYYNPFYYTIYSYDSFLDTYKLTALNENSGTEYLQYHETGKTVTNTLYTEMRLNYNREFGNHGVSGLLVMTTNEQLTANTGSLMLSLPYRNAGLAGRFTYNYKSRYFTEFNFGYNGSERFAKHHRWGFFPSVGLAWVISNEAFFKDAKKVVSNLKLRYSNGVVGNDNIGASSDRFYYLSNVSFANGTAIFGNKAQNRIPGVSVDRYANDNIGWETSFKQNLALELGLFGKIDIITDFYKEHRTNILMSRADIPVTMGLTSSIKANIGEALAKGIDIQGDYKQTWNRDLWTSARLNFTYARSEYLVYEEPEYVEPYRTRVGQSIKQAWGYIAESLFLDDAEAANSPSQEFGSVYGGGDIKYLDTNGDGMITNADRVPIGNPTYPEIIYGFGLSMGYKGFDLSVFFQGLANESFFINAASTSPFGGENQLLKAYADSHWSEAEPDIYALWPRLSPSANRNNVQQSTWWMRDGSFMRLKQMEFGYTLPRRVTKKAHIDNLRFYLSGTNLLTWSRFKLWDPELAGNGMNYPISRVVNLGLNVTFE